VASKISFGFGNSMGLQVQIDDLRLKYCIEGGALKIRFQEKILTMGSFGRLHCDEFIGF